MPDPKPDSVGPLPVPQKTDLKGTQPDDKKAKDLRARQYADERGGPLNLPRILHPTDTVEDAPAYRRADGSREKKGE